MNTSLSCENTDSGNNETTCEYTECPEAEYTECPEAEYTECPEAEYTECPEAEYTECPEAEPCATPTNTTAGEGQQSKIDSCTAIGGGLGALAVVLALTLVGVVLGWVWHCRNKR